MKNLSFPPFVFTVLGWLAPVLLVMGITAGLVSGAWGALPVGLLIAGGVFLLLWLLAEWRSLPGFFSRRSTQAGTNAIVATVAVVVILGLINFLSVRYFEIADLTENQLFTLSPQTQEVVSNLDRPTKVWVFWDESVPPSPTDQALLDNYSRESNQFSYEYVDPRVEVGQSREFGVETMGEVHLEIGESRRLVQVIDPDASRLSERQLTNAIVQATGDRQLTAYVLQGHGERELSPGQGGISEAIALLEGENYIVQPLNLTEQTTVPNDADVLILAGARRSLLEGEVEALQAFTQRQSGLMLLVDPDTDPGLDPIFEDWGVVLDDLLVIDPAAQSLQLGLTTALVQSYGDHPITREFGSGISFFPEAQVVELNESALEGSANETTPEDTPEDVPDDAADVTAPESAPLLITSEQTQAVEIPEDGAINLEEQPAIEGPLVLGVALNRPVELDEATTAPQESSDEATTNSDSESDAAEPEPPEAETQEAQETEETTDETSPEARLVVIGNSNFITNGLVNQQLNGDVFLNSVAWLSQSDDQTLSIRPREMTDRRLLLEPQQWWVIALTSVVILPILGIGGAIAIWLKRR